MAYRTRRDGALDPLPDKENAAGIIKLAAFNPFDLGRKGAAKVANKHARQANLGTALGTSDSVVGNVLEYNRTTRARLGCPSTSARRPTEGQATSP